jgi:hypothetical protein
MRKYSTGIYSGHKRADNRTYMRKYMRAYNANVSESETKPPEQNSKAIVERVLLDESLCHALSAMPRQKAYQFLFIQQNLEPHEAEEVLKALSF